ncbi:hypothetical protein Tcan_17034 [Toxocara canis]|uniref:Uncharacterized protein n=1 Tax=Toxocara canis TaxID=6265 RepID=A0A0B2VA11_TOXCA|nr:hypothetical protein Tcan_17034 [Toxocara canis]
MDTRCCFMDVVDVLKQPSMQSCFGSYSVPKSNLPGPPAHLLSRKTFNEICSMDTRCCFMDVVDVLKQPSMQSCFGSYSVPKSNLPGPPAHLLSRKTFNEICSMDTRCCFMDVVDVLKQPSMQSCFGSYSVPKSNLPGPPAHLLSRKTFNEICSMDTRCCFMDVVDVLKQPSMQSCFGSYSVPKSNLPGPPAHLLSRKTFNEICSMDTRCCFMDVVDVLKQPSMQSCFGSYSVPKSNLPGPPAHLLSRKTFNEICSMDTRCCFMDVVDVLKQPSMQSCFGSYSVPKSNLPGPPAHLLSRKTFNEICSMDTRCCFMDVVDVLKQPSMQSCFGSYSVPKSNLPGPPAHLLSRKTFNEICSMDTRCCFMDVVDVLKQPSMQSCFGSYSVPKSNLPGPPAHLLSRKTFNEICSMDTRCCFMDVVDVLKQPSMQSCFGSYSVPKSNLPGPPAHLLSRKTFNEICSMDTRCCFMDVVDVLKQPSMQSCFGSYSVPKSNLPGPPAHLLSRKTFNEICSMDTRCCFMDVVDVLKQPSMQSCFGSYSVPKSNLPGPPAHLLSRKTFNEICSMDTRCCFMDVVDVLKQPSMQSCFGSYSVPKSNLPGPPAHLLSRKTFNEICSMDTRCCFMDVVDVLKQPSMQSCFGSYSVPKSNLPGPPAHLLSRKTFNEICSMDTRCCFMDVVDVLKQPSMQSCFGSYSVPKSNLPGPPAHLLSRKTFNEICSMDTRCCFMDVVDVLKQPSMQSCFGSYSVPKSNLPGPPAHLLSRKTFNEICSMDTRCCFMDVVDVLKQPSMQSCFGSYSVPKSNLPGPPAHLLSRKTFNEICSMDTRCCFMDVVDVLKQPSMQSCFGSYSVPKSNLPGPPAHLLSRKTFNEICSMDTRCCFMDVVDVLKQPSMQSCFGSYSVPKSNLPGPPAHLLSRKTFNEICSMDTRCCFMDVVDVLKQPSMQSCFGSYSVPKSNLPGPPAHLLSRKTFNEICSMDTRCCFMDVVDVLKQPSMQSCFGSYSVPKSNLPGPPAHLLSRKTFNEICSMDTRCCFMDVVDVLKQPSMQSCFGSYSVPKSNLPGPPAHLLSRKTFNEICSMDTRCCFMDVVDVLKQPSMQSCFGSYSVPKSNLPGPPAHLLSRKTFNEICSMDTRCCFMDVVDVLKQPSMQSCFGSYSVPKSNLPGPPAHLLSRKTFNEICSMDTRCCFMDVVDVLKQPSMQSCFGSYSVPKSNLPGPPAHLLSRKTFNEICSMDTRCCFMDVVDVLKQPSMQSCFGSYSVPKSNLPGPPAHLLSRKTFNEICSMDTRCCFMDVVDVLKQPSMQSCFGSYSVPKSNLPGPPAHLLSRKTFNEICSMDTRCCFMDVVDVLKQPSMQSCFGSYSVPKSNLPGPPAHLLSRKTFNEICSMDTRCCFMDVVDVLKQPSMQSCFGSYSVPKSNLPGPPAHLLSRKTFNEICSMDTRCCFMDVVDVLKQPSMQSCFGSYSVPKSNLPGPPAHLLSRKTFNEICSMDTRCCFMDVVDVLKQPSMQSCFGSYSVPKSNLPGPPAHLLSRKTFNEICSMDTRCCFMDVVDVLKQPSMQSCFGSYSVPKSNLPGPPAHLLSRKTFNEICSMDTRCCFMDVVDVLKQPSMQSCFGSYSVPKSNLPGPPAHLLSRKTFNEICSMDTRCCFMDVVDVLKQPSMQSCFGSYSVPKSNLPGPPAHLLSRKTFNEICSMDTRCCFMDVVDVLKQPSMQSCFGSYSVPKSNLPGPPAHLLSRKTFNEICSMDTRCCFMDVVDVLKQPSMQSCFGSYSVPKSNLPGPPAHLLSRKTFNEICSMDTRCCFMDVVDVLKQPSMQSCFGSYSVPKSNLPGPPAHLLSRKTFNEICSMDTRCCFMDVVDVLKQPSMQSCFGSYSVPKSNLPGPPAHLLSRKTFNEICSMDTRCCFMDVVDVLKQPSMQSCFGSYSVPKSNLPGPPAHLLSRKTFNEICSMDTRCCFMDVVDVLKQPSMQSCFGSYSVPKSNLPGPPAHLLSRKTFNEICSMDTRCCFMDVVDVLKQPSMQSCFGSYSVPKSNLPGPPAHLLSRKTFNEICSMDTRCCFMDVVDVLKQPSMQSCFGSYSVPKSNLPGPPAHLLSRKTFNEICSMDTRCCFMDVVDVLKQPSMQSCFGSYSVPKSNLPGPPAHLLSRKTFNEICSMDTRCCFMDVVDVLKQPSMQSCFGSYSVPKSNLPGPPAHLLSRKTFNEICSMDTRCCFMDVVDVLKQPSMQSCFGSYSVPKSNLPGPPAHLLSRKTFNEICSMDTRCCFMDVVDVLKQPSMQSCFGSYSVPKSNLPGPPAHLLSRKTFNEICSMDTRCCFMDVVDVLKQPSMQSCFGSYSVPKSNLPGPPAHLLSRKTFNEICSMDTRCCFMDVVDVLKQPSMQSCFGSYSVPKSNLPGPPAHLLSRKTFNEICSMDTRCCFMDVVDVLKQPSMQSCFGSYSVPKSNLPGPPAHLLSRKTFNEICSMDTRCCFMDVVDVLKQPSMQSCFGSYSVPKSNLPGPPAHLLSRKTFNEICSMDTRCCFMDVVDVLKQPSMQSCFGSYSVPKSNLPGPPAHLLSRKTFNEICSMDTRCCFMDVVDVLKQPSMQSCFGSYSVPKSNLPGPPAHLLSRKTFNEICSMDTRCCFMDVVDVLKQPSMQSCFGSYSVPKSNLPGPPAHLLSRKTFNEICSMDTRCCFMDVVDVLKQPSMQSCFGSYSVPKSNLPGPPAHLLSRKTFNEICSMDTRCCFMDVVDVLKQPSMQSCFGSYSVPKLLF